MKKNRLRQTALLQVPVEDSRENYRRRCCGVSRGRFEKVGALFVARSGGESLRKKPERESAEV